MAEDKTNNNKGQEAVDPKIDAIKQLIFGDNMVEYDKRFDTLMDQIEKTKAAIEKKMDAQNQSLKNDLNELKTALEKSIDSLDKSTSKEMARLDDAKANRKALGKMLQNIGDKLSQ